MNIIKVSSKSVPQKVAGALANLFREGENNVEMQTIGAGALNQGIKAIAIARGYVISAGKELVCIPSFQDINLNGEERTAIKIIIKAL